MVHLIITIAASFNTYFGKILRNKHFKRIFRAIHSRNISKMGRTFLLNKDPVCFTFAQLTRSSQLYSYLFQQNSGDHDHKQETVPSHAELVKHPLQHSWTLWYYEPDRNKTWEDNQNQVSTFTTVEDFWSLFTHIKQPSEVKIGSDYSLFKENIRPMWEDKANKNGGRWMITLSRNQRVELDRYWIDTAS